MVRTRWKTAAAWSSAAAGLLAGALLPAARARPAGGAEPYRWRNARIAGGGFVTGLVFDPAERGLAYARTDVGGAYRWDDAAGRWIPLLDWLSASDWNLLGIESLAVDPCDPDRVYVAAGTYTGPWAGRGEIMRSDDRGRTWRRTAMPFKMGGNEAGRFNGERLAVDPNCPRILLFGSRADGLWRSDDRAASWRRVDGFPRAAAEGGPAIARSWGPPERVGIVCAAFDPRSGSAGRPTPVIYAAVSTPGASLFRSLDGGVGWQAVAGQPPGLRPNHLALAPDGILYLSYGKEPGPDAMTDGAVWSWNPRTGAWADLTPIKPAAEGRPFGYGDVAVDPERPAVLMASTFCRWKPHDEIFRSTDRGRHWRPLIGGSSWDRSLAPWTASLRPHWIGTIAIDPFDSDRAFFTTGYGVWEGTDLARTGGGAPAHWVFADLGLEETVPLALISPPSGAHLLSAVADVDGFRHDDLDAAPPQFRAPPRLSTAEGIDFAAKAPDWVARVGVARKAGGTLPAGAYSTDGGRSWAPFASAPPGVRGAGSIAVSADGAVFIWASRLGPPGYSSDRGRTWKPCAGAPPGMSVASDRVENGRFYGFDSATGVFFRSADRGMSFRPVHRGLPTPRSPLAAGPSDLRATPGIEGDVWLVADGTLFHSTDGGAAFSRVTSADRASAIGFGKPPRTGAYPTLFLAGRAGGADGLFRSDDAAGSWIRISDDRHRFAAVSRITGDPRVFGRVYLATGGRGILYGDPR